MPLYIYEEVLPDGSGGAVFEFIQSIHDPAFTEHPETHVPVRRRVTAPWMPKAFGRHLAWQSAPSRAPLWIY